MNAYFYFTPPFSHCCSFSIIFFFQLWRKRWQRVPEKQQCQRLRNVNWKRSC